MVCLFQVLLQGKSSEAQDGDAVEEEDEEESSDEADLSKYDLWGSDAEQENTSKGQFHTHTSGFSNLVIV